MANIHLFLQGKGGVGKSFCCAMLAQYLHDSGRKPVCIDTDPINATLSAYKAFDAMRLEILKGDKIDTSKFDTIIERIESSSETDSVLIDNGASSFIAFSEYILSNEVPNLLHGMGHSLIINTVITGGDAQGDTISGFEDLATNFRHPTKLIVWLNPYYGSIEHGGKKFEDFKVFQDNREMVCGMISIPPFHPETFGRDLSQMLKARLTFTEALDGATYPIMTRQRLKMMQREIYNQLSIVPEI